MKLTQTSHCPDDSVTCEVVYDVTSSEPLGILADNVLSRGTAILVVVLGTLVVRWLVHRLIDRLVRRAESGVSGYLSQLSVGMPASSAGTPPDRQSSERRTARARAMGSLLKSIVSVVLFSIMALMVVGLLGLPLGPLLTSAGVLGVAFGIGAQNLVKDFLAGVFMILEDQYGVGDQITFGDTTGTVEAVGLRVTRLRDDEQTAWYVRNGEVARVGNRSHQGAPVVVEVTVSANEDLDRVKRLLEGLCEELDGDSDFRGMLVTAPVVADEVTTRGETVTFRLAAQATTQEQWRVSRELRAAARTHLQAQEVDLARAPWIG